MPLVSFCTPEVFWCFQELQKENSDIKWADKNTKEMCWMNIELNLFSPYRPNSGQREKN